MRVTDIQAATHESWLVRCSPRVPGFSGSRQQKVLVCSKPFLKIIGILLLILRFIKSSD